MSELYSVVGTICYGLNKLPGGGIEKIIDKVLTTSTGKEKLPVWVKRPCSVREVFLGGFFVYVIRHRDPKKRREKSVLFLADGAGMCLE